MTAAPYAHATHAIRAALSVDAVSLYKPASWQRDVKQGYREAQLRGDLSRADHFAQDCMTAAYLFHRMTGLHWAMLVVCHAPPLHHKGRRCAETWEIVRMQCSAEIVGRYLAHSRLDFATWAVLHYARRWPKDGALWDQWAADEVGLRTLKRHYGERMRPVLREVDRQAESMAADLLLEGGLLRIDRKDLQNGTGSG